MIEIHTSERASFKKCRRRWNWTSPNREDLVPKRSVSGIAFPLWFGTGIHHALERYYDPVLREDPVITFSAWYTKEYELIEKENPSFVEEFRDDFEEHWDTGRGMMTFYKDYSQRNDDFDVIYAEHDFKVPLWAGVYYAGRMDAVIQDRATGRYGIIDHKTATSIGEDYFVKLDMDDQCTSYIAAAIREHDVPYMGHSPDYVLYNVLRKAYPKPPTILYKKNTDIPRALSVDRANESTTAQMFDQSLLDNRLVEWYEGNEKAQGYRAWLEDQGDENFIIRYPVTRNATEVANKWKHINAEAEDMVNDPKLYPNPTGDFTCTRCAFRAPCLAMDDGSDYQAILDANYERKPKVTVAA